MSEAETGENRIERDERGRLLPGSTTNPDGRPKGSLSITALIKAELIKEMPNQKEGEKKTFVEALIRKLLHKAIIDGDHKTQKMIWNYIEGLPKGSLDITSNGQPIPIYGGRSVNPDFQGHNSDEKGIQLTETN